MRQALRPFLVLAALGLAMFAPTGSAAPASHHGGAPTQLGPASATAALGLELMHELGGGG
jgi:hypothetical protein